MNVDLGRKFWLALCRNAEGEGDGGGAGGEGGQAGADSAGGEGAAGSAGAGESSPSLLSQAAAAAGESTVKGDDGASTLAGEDGKTVAEGEASAPFDAKALTLPEGAELAEETSAAFAEILGDEKLTSQERGQKLVDLHMKAITELQDTLKAASIKTFNDMNDGWRKEIPELPEFKENPEAEMGKIFQALKTVGADEKFFQAVDLTGAGNHPAILQVLHRLVQPFLEGGPVNGDSKTVAKRELGANIYTKSQPK